MFADLGIDPASWQVTVLPHPKRFARSKAMGFCGGQPVGVAETSRAVTAATWWPGGRPELLALAGQSQLFAARAGGAAIPGSWTQRKSGRCGAVAWVLRDGALAGTDLHVPRYEKTWASAAGGGCVVGVGKQPGTLQTCGPDHGLVWRDGAEPAVIDDPAGDVSLDATDGLCVAGHVAYRASLWPHPGAARIDLAPGHGYLGSEVQAVDGEFQVGIAFRELCARAALWRGDAASFTDLTPDGYETSRAFGAAGAFQVGLMRRTETTANGSSSLADQAVIWRAAADRHFDLNSILPPPFNASVAWAIEIEGDVVRICGEASRYEASDPGTEREAHYLPMAQAVVWSARLR